MRAVGGGFAALLVVQQRQHGGDVEDRLGQDRPQQQACLGQAEV